ncbi:MAG: hybrid sensor histidine kinase/response regulator [Bacteroidota bacterium]
MLATTESSQILKVLLVEDEDAHRELITRKFRSHENIKLCLAKSLNEAKSLVSKSIPDLAIVDYNMPDGKGIELIHAQKRKQYPIVLMTSYGDEKLAVKALKSGAFDYIVKSAAMFNELPRIAKKIYQQWEHINHKKKSEQKIKKQNSQLKKINAELDRFVYSASHELRAPLMSVMGLINLSKVQNSDPSQQEYLNMMEECLKRLDKYIKDITDYSRNNRMEPEIGKIDPEEVVENILRGQSFLPGFSKVRKEIKIQSRFALYSDVRRLEVILNNIISNAIKYHNYNQPDPFLLIEIEVRRAKYVINIVDNGCGISAEHLDKIFKMFYRATESSEGSGLGLYITKETVDKLKGTISVRSFLKTGTRFTVVLPNRKPRQTNNE